MTAVAGVRDRRASPARVAAFTWPAVAAVLLVAVAVFGTDPPYAFAGDGLLRGWVQFDGNWYFSIAQDGYYYIPGQQSSVAFFPSYPLLMRAVGWVVGSPALAGILLTAAAGLASALLFARWCASRLPTRTARLAVVLLLVYPFAWYLYGAVYADALLLLCALAAFHLVEVDRPVLAGLVGVVATAARPTGLAVTVGLVALVLERREIVTWDGGFRFRFHRSRLGRLRWADAGVLLSVAGLAAYCVYLFVRWDDPIAFVTVQEAPGWNQGAGPYTWFKVLFLKFLVDWPDTAIVLKLVVHALFTLGALLLVPRVIKRFGWAYGAYVVAALGIPLIGSSTFMGLARYSLAAFPCFAGLATVLDERAGLARVLVPASAVGLVALTILYAQNNYVS